MKCHVCGGAELIADTRDVSYMYKGETTVIEDLTGDFCPSCSEIIMDRLNADLYGTAINSFKKQVNSASINPVFISTTRKKLDLDQRQAAELFGGGPNAFSRYENGRTKPPLALVQLFKLLDHHPELLQELKDSATDPDPSTVPSGKESELA